MRKLATLSIVLLMGITASFSQDPVLIIDEDFQDWPATEGAVSDPPDQCEDSHHITGPGVYDLTYETGGTGQIWVIKYMVSPECNTKRVNVGDAASNAIDVTTGFVQLRKVDAEGDTIGEMRLPKLTNVTRIEFGYSCTSSTRGVRLYTSTDDGETWEGPWTADGPGIGEIIGSDAQLGEMVDLDINRDNVILKFTSGIDLDDVSQHTRIHNIKVWGVPGAPETGIEETKTTNIHATYLHGTGLVIRGEAISVRVFDLQGRMIIESYEAGDQVIPMEGRADGTYILKTEDTGHRVYTTKFIKQ